MEKSTTNDKLFPNQLVNKNKVLSRYEDEGISSLNRSIVFDNSIIGPDISWLVPPGFKWNNQYKFDASTRGHSRRDKGEDFGAGMEEMLLGNFIINSCTIKKLVMELISV